MEEDVLLITKSNSSLPVQWESSLPYQPVPVLAMYQTVGRTNMGTLIIKVEDARRI